MISARITRSTNQQKEPGMALQNLHPRFKSGRRLQNPSEIRVIGCVPASAGDFLLLPKPSNCSSLRRATSVNHLLRQLAAGKADNRAIFTAASHVQRAADFVIGLQPAASAGSLPTVASGAHRIRPIDILYVVAYSHTESL